MKTRKTILSTAIISMLFASIIMANIPLSYASMGPVMAVSPTVYDGITANLHVGDSFFIEITIWNVTRMLGYEFRLLYDTNVLTATSFQSYPPFTTEWPSGINDGAGYVDMVYSYPLPEIFGLDIPDSSPPFPMARIDFTIDADGYSPFNLINTVVGNVDGGWYDHEITNGRFYNIEIHDIAVTSVTRNQTMVLQNRTISIAATVMNNGTFDSGSFDVTAYYNGTQIGSPQTVTNLIPKTDTTLTFLWNTTGVSEGTYVISANATTVTGETNTADNTLIDGTVAVVLTAPHDVAVIDVTPSPTFVIQGDNVTINVTVENQGLVSETFNVTAYYNSSLIGNQGTTVPALTNDTLTFTWNTTGVSFGFYTISANASVVPEETDTADNSFTDGTVGIGLHDINVMSLDLFPSPSVVGTTVSMSPIIKNEGKQNETFTVSFYYNNTLITNRTVTDLIPGGIYSFDPPVPWDTSALSAAQYIIKVEVQPFVGEVDTADNSRTQAITLVLKVHDIAVTEIVANQTTVLRGKAVNITVTIQNQGNVVETCNVTVSFDSTLIETKTGIVVAVGESKALNFTWTTPSDIAPKIYTIKGEVPALSGEIDTTDNSKTTQVTVAIHDIAVTNVTPSKTAASVGESITITVTVKNQGNFTESFQVTARYGNTNIGTQSVANLAKGLSRTLTFTWSTTGVSPGTYVISANASTVTGEEITTNNALEGSSVTLKLTSTISITVTPTTVTVGDKVTISGSITPTRSGAKVTIWYRLSGATTWNNLTVVQTDSSSQYSYVWTTTATGNYEIKTSWPGDTNTLLDESDIASVAVQEATNILMYAIAGIIAIIVIVVILFYIFRIRKR